MAGKIYPLNLIKYWYTYDVADICRLYKKYGLHKQTVRGWISRGLKTIDEGKPALIYGNDLIEFLKKKNQSYKRAITFEELFCFKCQEPSFPYKKKIQIDYREHFIRVTAFCRACKTTMYKSYKLSDLPQLKLLFHVVGVLELNDSKASTAKTHLDVKNTSTANEPFQMELLT